MHFDLKQLPAADDENWILPVLSAREEYDE